MRVWLLAPGPRLTGGPGLLPLAPIIAVTPAELPGIITEMGRRLGGRRARAQAPLIWASAYILLGLRYSPALAARLFRGVVSMKESATYQAILEEGREMGREMGRGEGAVAEARKLLRLLGEGKFGEADAATAAALERIDDLPRLEDCVKRLPTAPGWRELLDLPVGGSP